MMSASSSRASSATIPSGPSQPRPQRLLMLGQVQRPRLRRVRPGSSSWTRHSKLLIVAVRWRHQVFRRSTSNFSSRDDLVVRRPPAGPVPAATARATANASIGSDLPRVRADARASAIIFGGTRTTCCPAVEQIPLQPGRQVPAILDRPHHLATPNCVLRPRATPCHDPSWSPRRSADRAAPTSSTATNVWVRLCTSAPTTTMMVASFTPVRDGWAGRRTHLSGGDATLLSSHAGRSVTPECRQNACIANPKAALTL